MRLNWLILNISFIFSWFSLGMTTGLPPSPGPSRGLLRASAGKRTSVCYHLWEDENTSYFGVHVCAVLHTHPISPAILSPSCRRTCCTRWSRAEWTCPTSPTPRRWPGPPCSRQTASSYTWEQSDRTAEQAVNEEECCTFCGLFAGSAECLVPSCTLSTQPSAPQITTFSLFHLSFCRGLSLLSASCLSAPLQMVTFTLDESLSMTDNFFGSI